jgi:hypothetical protein
MIILRAVVIGMVLMSCGNLVLRAADPASAAKTIVQSPNQRRTIPGTPPGGVSLPAREGSPGEYLLNDTKRIKKEPLLMPYAGSPVGKPFAEGTYNRERLPEIASDHQLLWNAIYFRSPDRVAGLLKRGVSLHEFCYLVLCRTRIDSRAASRVGRVNYGNMMTLDTDNMAFRLLAADRGIVHTTALPFSAAALALCSMAQGEDKVASNKVYAQLKKVGVDMNVKNAKGNTPLHTLAQLLCY